MRSADTIIWHVHPLSFTGAEATNDGGLAVTHRLPHLEAWLDHLVALGANALQLGPIFDSESHGYDTRDHLRIDARLGDEGDLRHLVEQAHARGVEVVLDGVFNHVGRSHERFRAAQAGDEQAAAWFARDPDREDGWAVFEGHEALVELDLTHPPVREHVVAVVRHWLDAGVDGWRLDAAYAVAPAAWREIIDQVRASHPHAWFLGETIHADPREFAPAAGVDSLTQYEMWKAIWSSLNDANFHELAHALGRHDAFVATGRAMDPPFVPTTFLGNHDTTRIASQLHDRRHLVHAVTALFTLPGVPAVYAGDEWDYRGVKEERAGGDDAVRPAFPATPEGLWAEGEPVFRLHQRLIGLRRRHRWLWQAAVAVERVEDAVLVYRLSEVGPPGGAGGDEGGRGAGARGLSVVLNLTDAPVSFAPREGEQLLEGTVEAHSAAVFGRP
ncbi:alpha-amylase family glycosyl hydrolase [Streptomyces sp. NP160]|uniref:alpha-amylase family glycosyl hydrolase n=1 Tax=Streptomyces sp. NP160 TaxID=2586637 RepID=UPI001C585F93|nr:alpha-amylase family glycosyl hydrolase [Streptomyces sp. NP160]